MCIDDGHHLFRLESGQYPSSLKFGAALDPLPMYNVIWKLMSEPKMDNGKILEDHHGSLTGGISVRRIGKTYFSSLVDNEFELLLGSFDKVCS